MFTVTMKDGSKIKVQADDYEILDESNERIIRFKPDTKSFFKYDEITGVSRDNPKRTIGTFRGRSSAR
jgi:hypothetical protein